MNFPLRVLTAAFFLSFCGAVPAAVRMVTNLNDSGAGSLRGVIAAASSGDTINFGVTGTITLTSGELRFDKNLTISGPGAPELLTIARNITVGTPAFGIFSFSVSDRSTVHLSGLTISNGRAAFGGGALRCDSDVVTVTNCVFRNNTATDNGGGAILSAFGGSLSVNNCVFEGNSASFPGSSNPAPDGGGAIMMLAQKGDNSSDHMTLNVQSSQFLNNQAQSSGGAVAGFVISNAAGTGTASVTATFDNCTFTENAMTASIGSGGGIAIEGSLTVRTSTFTRNSAKTGGGGIYCTAGVLTIDDSSFDGNSSVYRGGAVYNFTTANATFRNCLFAGNKADPGDGGAIYNSGQLTLHNCTLSGNSAVREPSPSLRYGYTGGIHHAGSALSLLSCTFAGNTSVLGAHSIHQTLAAGSMTLGNTILGDTAPTLVTEGPHITSLGYNLSRDNGALYMTGPGDQYNTDPKLDLMGLQNNGGPTRTILIHSNSTALDRGHRMGLTTDQRGFPRPNDRPSYPNASGGDGSDIGAYESGDPVQPSPIVVNTLHDHDDGVAGAADCTLREAIGRANAVTPGSTAIVFRADLTGTLTLDRLLGLLVVTRDVSITGPGARALSISAGGYMRVLTFAGPGVRTVSGLRITEGREEGAARTAAFGGGIYTEGVLTMNDCTLAYNTARGGIVPGAGEDGYGSQGGGIFNTGGGALTLNRCTFTGCVASATEGTSDPDPMGSGGSGGSSLGGAIYHDGSNLVINACTFQGNSATGAQAGNSRIGGNGGNGRGGAVFNNGKPMTVTASTFVGNVSVSGQGGKGFNAQFDGFAGIGSGAITALAGGSKTVRNSLIAGNVRNTSAPSDVIGAFVSGGYNLIGTADGSTGFTAATDQKGTNAAPLSPLLGPFQNNGGQTDTMQPLTGSPAIDKGKSFEITIDQRGLPRPIDGQNIPNASGGDGSDIGSVETDGPQGGPLFVITTLDDHDDGVASHLDCSLREALIAANAVTRADTVIFKPGLTGVIVLKSALGGLTITDSLTLIGPGARDLIVQAPQVSRLLNVQGGPHFISGFKFYGGTLVGIVDGTPGAGSVMGAGILNRSVLTLTDCAITNSIAQAGDNNVVPTGRGGDATGSGIANISGGVLTLNRCTLAENRASAGRGGQNASASGPGGDATGAAIFNDTGCTLTIVNCTIVQNGAVGGHSGNSGAAIGVMGGQALAAICNRGIMNMTSATLRGNSGIGGLSGAGMPRGKGAGGIIAIAGSTSHVRNSLSAENIDSNFERSDVAGAFTSGGFNLLGSSETSTGFTAATDQRGTKAAPLNPLFSSFFNFGGPTDTQFLQPGSPAIDRGKSFGLPCDQRGSDRTWNDPALANATGGDGTDIGAFEHRPAWTGEAYFVNITREPVMYLQVQGLASVPYRLHVSGDMGFFTPVGPVKTPGSSGLVDFTDPVPLPGRRFYKAVSVP